MFLSQISLALTRPLGGTGTPPIPGANLSEDDGITLLTADDGITTLTED